MYILAILRYGGLYVYSGMPSAYIFDTILATPVYRLFVVNFTLIRVFKIELWQNVASLANINASIGTKLSYLYYKIILKQYLISIGFIQSIVETFFFVYLC